MSLESQSNIQQPRQAPSLAADSVADTGAVLSPVSKSSDPKTTEPYVYSTLKENQIRLFCPDYSRPAKDGIFGTLKVVDLINRNGTNTENSPLGAPNAIVNFACEALSYA